MGIAIENGKIDRRQRLSVIDFPGFTLSNILVDHNYYSIDKIRLLNTQESLNLNRMHLLSLSYTFRWLIKLIEMWKSQIIFYHIFITKECTKFLAMRGYILPHGHPLDNIYSKILTKHWRNVTVKCYFIKLGSFFIAYIFVRIPTHRWNIWLCIDDLVSRSRMFPFVPFVSPYLLFYILDCITTVFTIKGIITEPFSVVTAKSQPCVCSSWIYEQFVYFPFLFSDPKYWDCLFCTAAGIVEYQKEMQH